MVLLVDQRFQFSSVLIASDQELGLGTDLGDSYWMLVEIVKRARVRMCPPLQRRDSEQCCLDL